MIDLHCHILPGLDDGPSSMEAALEMCQIAAADGIHTIVATPHMLNGVFEVPPEAVYQGIEALSMALREQGIPLRILPGGDVHVHPALPGLLESGKVMTIGAKGRHLMIELPQDVFPAELKDVLFQIQLKGVTPLISHPERHAAIQHDPALLADLIHAGSLTQVTAGSLDGSFGPRIQDCALKLLRRNMVHVVASDAHNCEWRAPRLSTARQIVQHARGEREAALLFLERPAQILEGAYIESPEPETERERPKKRGLLSRLFSS